MALAFVVVSFAASLLNCKSGEQELQSAEPKAWPTKLPAGFEAPVLEPDSTPSPQILELGRYLFYDTRLSANNNRSCGLCHEQVKAFSDGFARAFGTHGGRHLLNSPTLTNIGYRDSLNWSSLDSLTLERQLEVPLYSESPIIEMGMSPSQLRRYLNRSPKYNRLFARAFPDRAGEDILVLMANSIAGFQRGLISGNSRYDRYSRGEVGALSDLAIQGMQHFFGDRARCYVCHSGQDLDREFESRSGHRGRGSHGYHNIGLYNVRGESRYPPGEEGLFETTRSASDVGRYRTPTLRNLEASGPYMHDGTVATIDDAVKISLAGGRDLKSGPYAGDGRLNRHRSSLIQPVVFSDDERLALVTFLRSLTDHEFLSRPSLRDPRAAERSPSYAEVQGLFSRRCGCHLREQAPAGLDLRPIRSLHSLLRGRSREAGLPFVVPGRPDESYLLHKVMGSQLVLRGGEGAQMPPPPVTDEPWDPLDAQELAMIRNWIRDGALRSPKPVE